MKFKFAFILIALAILAAPGAQVFAANSAAVIPTFVIKAVDQNNVVTIQTDNLLLNDSYVVTMGVMGSKGVNGYYITTVATTDTGRLTLTFSIPAALYGQHQIAIRLQSPTTGYYAYNWFYNSDANLHLITEPVLGGSGGGTTTATYTCCPYFHIGAVAKGASVTITPYNFPPNQTFDVRMNWMYTRGVAGAIITTVTTDANGQFDAAELTYDIPDFLQNTDRIAIRLESPISGYYGFNWFYNNDAP